MTLLIVSFIAGVLTVLAPCVLPLLPVVIGSSASGRSPWTPYIVIGSLAFSIIAFTYLLKASTAFIMVPPQFWMYLSGGILFFFGLTLLFPALWESVPGLSKVSASSNKLVGTGYQRQSFAGDVLIGAALGPVFSTCSPTYFVILASVLPASFALGTLYLLAYVLGLSLVLLLIALLGQRLSDRLALAADPRGYWKRGIGVLFVVLGILIATGYEKKLETAILESGYFDITKIEQFLLKKVPDMAVPISSIVPTSATTLTTTLSIAPKTAEASAPRVPRGNPYKEIVRPSGFVNIPSTSSGQAGVITIGELVGKKVILVDFLTYSCINCQRTFPYLNAWYEKYKDQGLEIVGIHTPEFAFERNIENVREAMRGFGITHPIVLDNDYATWNAYGNRYWPRKYLIDIYGNIAYDHIGEGAYEETEMKIRELLAERANVLKADMKEIDDGLASSSIAPVEVTTRSPETYFGSLRNEYLANGAPGQQGEKIFSLPGTFQRDALYLGGEWNITPEYAESVSADAELVYRYYAKEVYIVAESSIPVEVEILQDGNAVEGNGVVTVHESKLYTLIRNGKAGEHILKLRVRGAGVRLYAFTFG